MGEPQVRLILFSGLLGSFLGSGGSHSACDEAYRRITEAGVRVVFVDGAADGAASQSLVGLDPAPELLAGGDPRAAVKGYVAAVRAVGDIPVTMGIGGGPDHGFLDAVDQAAVIPTEACEPAAGLTYPNSAYICRNPGPAGWIEWAEILLRRIDLATLKR